MNKPNSESLPMTTEGWETINWQKVERYVFKLQKRIYAASRQGNKRQVRQLQKTLIANKKWVFATKDNSFRLLEHQEFAGSSNKYVKVKGEKSPYDGDLVYWSSRMGRHPEMPQRKAFLLKQQKGFCPWCKLKFREEDILEIDHIQSIALGGKDEWQNLQLLHGHCHDSKTANDLVKIRELKSSQYLEKLAKELQKLNYLWIDDIPVILNT